MNDIVLDDLANVNLVVSLLEDTVLAGILDLDVVEQLQPQVLKLIRIVLEEIKVVTYCREDFIKLCLKITTVVFRAQLHDFLRLVFACLLIFFGWLRGLRIENKTVFLRVFIELVLDCTDNTLNFLLE